MQQIILIWTRTDRGRINSGRSADRTRAVGQCGSKCGYEWLTCEFTFRDRRVLAGSETRSRMEALSDLDSLDRLDGPARTLSSLQHAEVLVLRQRRRSCVGRAEPKLHGASGQPGSIPGKLCLTSFTGESSLASTLQETAKYSYSVHTPAKEGCWRPYRATVITA